VRGDTKLRGQQFNGNTQKYYEMDAINSDKVICQNTFFTREATT